MLFFSFILCAIISYASTWFVFKSSKISIYFSLLYTFCLYHLTNLSERNALGEILSCIFIPIVFWGLYEIIKGDYKRKWYIVGLGFAFLITTHLVTSYLVFFVLLLYIVIYCRSFFREPRRFLFLVYSGILATLLSSFFLLPFLEQYMDNTFYYQTQPYFRGAEYRLLPISHIIKGLFRGISITEINATSVGITLMLPLGFIFFIKKKSKTILLADVSMLVGLFLLFITSDLISWTFFPFTLLKVVIFPWRLVGISSLLFAFSASIYLSFVSLNNKRFVAICLLTITILFASIKVTSAIFLKRYRNYTPLVETNLGLRTYDVGGYEYIPASVPIGFETEVEDGVNYSIPVFYGKRGNLTIITSENTNISNISRYKSKFYFDLETNNNITAELPLLYYKGYKATLDGENLNLRQSSNGLVEIDIPTSGKVVVWYNGTLVQKVSLIISLLTLVYLAIYIIRVNKSNKTK